MIIKEMICVKNIKIGTFLIVLGNLLYLAFTVFWGR